ncbi:T9SS type A sorting domain-containing protein, partial [bacterium]|nr:T9SS type A sorting domain-containing protein [bacterium]
LTITLRAYPNPFNPSTTISFDLPQSGYVSLQVFDMLGRLVESLEGRVLQAGPHTTQFHGNDLASGIYFVQLKSNQQVSAQRIVFIK